MIHQQRKGNLLGQENVRNRSVKSYASQKYIKWFTRQFYIFLRRV